MSAPDKQRVNAGYTITDSLHVGTTEFVLGENSAAPSCYVTWECKNGSNYYWGHYMDDRLDAVKDLLDRAGQELEYQMSRKMRSAKSPPKEADKERDSR